MDDSQEYLVPAGFGQAEFTEKRSRFIGRVWPVASEGEALTRLAEVRKRHHDATHNVYAYILKDGVTRYSDDGEPKGTSGQPTLNVLAAQRLYNVCCVVTRYYGGILLGAGGLVRAYSRAAGMALDQAGIAVMRHWSLLEIPCPYPLYERIAKLIAGCGGFIEKTEFASDVMIWALVPDAETASCFESIKDMSAGGIAARLEDKVFKAFPV